jgi:arginine:pyruvate transaminase
MPHLTYLRPESGMFIMVNVSDLFDDDKEFAQRLLDAEAVSVLPGSAFGQGTTGHVRLSLVQPQEILMKGCDRIEKFVRSFG